MKFLITMNMPSNKGNMVHQIIGEINKCNCLADVYRKLNEQCFIWVEEYYFIRNKDEPGEYVKQIPILINTEHIGKVKEAREIKDLNY